jgi:putative acetyltransferase
MMAIRLYENRDAETLAQIFHAAVEGLAPKFYNPAQVRAWSARGADVIETNRRCRDGRVVWVATDANDKAIAFMDLETNGYIDMLFCHPSRAGKGITSALFRMLEAHARELKIQTLTTDASAVAQAVFTHWGFETTTRNDFERDGVKMFNYTMQKHIT